MQQVVLLVSLLFAGGKAPPVQASTTGTSEALTPQRLVEGMCDYYSKIDTLTVEFTESFETLVREDRTDQFRPIEVGGKWTTKIDEQMMLAGPHAAPKRLQLSFLKGGEFFVRGSGDDDALRVLLHTWDGETAQRLEDALPVGARQPFRTASGTETGGGPFDDHGVRISKFLLYHLQGGARAELAKRYDVERTGLRTTETGTVAGVKAIKVSAKSQDYDVTFALWIAPEHDYLVVRDEAYWSNQKQPFFLREATRIGRFGDLSFPTEGYIRELNSLANPKLDPKRFDHENHFKIRNVVLNEPVDDATFRIQWPPNTLVRDVRTDITYRTSPGDPAARSAALDASLEMAREALALAKANRPPPITGTRWWHVGLYVMIGVVVIAIGTAALLKWRRATR